MPRRGAMGITCSVTREEYTEFLDRFVIPSCYSPFYLVLGTLPLTLHRCHISFLNPYGAVRFSSFDVACKAYGAEPTLPLFRRGAMGITCSVTREEYTEFLNRFVIPSCYSPFYLVLGTLPLTLHRCHISFLNPYGAVRFSSFDVACKAYGAEPTLPLFRGLLCIQLFLLMARYPGNHPVTIADVPFNAAMHEEGPNESIVRALEGGSVACLPSYGVTSAATLFGSSYKAGGCSGFIGPFDTFEEDSDSDPFLPGDVAACESRDILSRLDHSEIQRRLDGLSLTELANFHDVFALRFIMSSSMLSREARSSSLEVLRLRDEVFRLKGEQSVSAATIAKLDDRLSCVEVGSSKEVLEVDVEALRSGCHKFDEKEAIMLAIKASLKVEIESLKEKLRSAVKDRSLMVIDLLPHAMKVLLTGDSFSTLLADLQKKVMLVSRAQAFEEVAGMSLCFQLKDVKDYDPNVMEAFDKVIDDFYHVEFPYLDLLAYHARGSLGFLTSLEPPSLPPHKPFIVGRIPLTRTALMHSLEAARYTIRLSPALGATSVGSFSMYFFISLKALSASFVHAKSFFSKHPYNVLKKGSLEDTTDPNSRIYTL
nr:hypothetical protein [Tanacetum cinerariifolium]